MTVARQMVFGLVIAALPMMLASPAATAPQGRYCVMQFGLNGDRTGPCVYNDLQTCREVAARQRGNCVANMDYRGDRPQPRRHMQDIW